MDCIHLETNSSKPLLHQKNDGNMLRSSRNKQDMTRCMEAFINLHSTDDLCLSKRLHQGAQKVYGFYDAQVMTHLQMAPMKIPQLG